MATRRQPCHQPVARPGTEPRPDVRTRCDPVQPDPSEQADSSKCEPVRSRHRRQTKVDHGPDHDDVAERAEAGPLAQRNPESEHYRADDDRPGADPKPEPAREALVEHIPRIDPESREQHERVTEAVEREARVKLAEATQPRRRHQTPRLTADHSWSCTCNPWVHRLALKHFTAAPDLRGRGSRTSR